MAYITGKFETLGSNFRHEIRFSEVAAVPCYLREVQFYSRDHSHPKRNFIISFEEKGLLAVA